MTEEGLEEKNVQAGEGEKTGRTILVSKNQVEVGTGCSGKWGPSRKQGGGETQEVKEKGLSRGGPPVNSVTRDQESGMAQRGKR